jgi:hypothetical protein
MALTVSLAVIISLSCVLVSRVSNSLSLCLGLCDWLLTTCKTGHREYYGVASWVSFPSSDPFGSLLSLSGSIVPLPLVAIPMVYHSKRQHPKGATNEMPSLHITKAERARAHTLPRLEKARACVTIHGHVLLYVEIQ